MASSQSKLNANYRYYEKHKHKLLSESRDSHRKNPVKSMWKNAKARAKKKNLDFDLDIEDIVIPDICPVLGIEIMSGNYGVIANSPSIDRIDSTKGYIKTNIQVISHLANTMKGVASPNQLLKFADWIYKMYGHQNDT